MIGCTSVTDDPTLAIDRTELEDARWFTREELLAARAAGEAGTDLLYFPRPFAIAHHLVTWWLDR
jgi:NAD+ diphosphatase